MNVNNIKPYYIMCYYPYTRAPPRLNHYFQYRLMFTRPTYTANRFESRGKSRKAGLCNDQLITCVYILLYTVYCIFSLFHMLLQVDIPDPLVPLPEIPAGFFQIVFNLWSFEIIQTSSIRTGTDELLRSRSSDMIVSPEDVFDILGLMYHNHQVR